MKIQSYGVTGVNPYQSQQTKAAAAKTNSASFRDQLEISSQAKDLQGIQSYETNRSEKVAALKEQIQNGTYQVDSNKLAQDLLNYYRR